MSLCQYLGLQEPGFLRILLEKHGLSIDSLYQHSHDIPGVMNGIRDAVFSRHHGEILSLMGEIVETQGDLRVRITPRYRYDERWNDLIRCLQLDGYTIEGHNLIPFDPTIEGVEPLEDDFTKELKSSRLVEAEEILEMLDKSADAFRKADPDFNACLTNARVALETLVKAIAKARQIKHPHSFDETRWGEVVAYLRTSGLITQNDEKGIAGVYSFVSQGAHTPVGLSEQEMARLGRSLVASICYFLVKLHNQQISR